MRACPRAFCRPFLERSAIVSLGAAFCLAVALVSQLRRRLPSLPGCWATGGSSKARVTCWRTAPAIGNTGELLGAEWAQGEFGTALHFTGKDSCAIVPQLSGLDGSNELTVEAWVLWEAGGRYPNILTGGQWCPGGFMIFVADRSCSFRMGRPGPRPGEPALPWQETSAPLVSNFEIREMVPPGGHVQAAGDHDLRERTEGGLGHVGLPGRLPGRPADRPVGWRPVVPQGIDRRS